MNVAFLVHRFPALSITFILDQITGLIDRGHHVDIYANERGHYPQVHPEVEAYGLLDHTEFFIATPGHPAQALWRGLGLLATTLPKAPVAVLRSLNAFKYGRHAYSMRLLYGTASLMPRVRAYDIIHGHFGPAGIKGALLRDLGVFTGKLVASFYGYDVSQYPLEHGKAVYRRHLFERGDLFLPLSQHMKRRLEELGCDRNKIVVHHIGIDPGRFAFQPRQPQQGEPVRLISVARYVEKKGLSYAIEAVARLNLRYPVEYRIIGDGPLRPRLEALIRDLNLGDRIQLLGWQQRPEVVKHLAQAHLFLAPSVVGTDGDEEGTPTAIMEASAIGLPVISTFHSGIPELVLDGESGLLVPERNVDALVTALAQLLDHPEHWPEMGRAGRGHIERHYDVDTLNDRLVSHYERLLRPG